MPRDIIILHMCTKNVVKFLRYGAWQTDGQANGQTDEWSEKMTYKPTHHLQIKTFLLASTTVAPDRHPKLRFPLDGSKVNSAFHLSKLSPLYEKGP